MRDADFEWDDRKADANVRKHGLSFVMARRAFAASRFLDKADDDPDEDRATRIAEVDGRLIAVTYVERGRRIRIISARKATRHERAGYDEQG